MVGCKAVWSGQVSLKVGGHCGGLLLFPKLLQSKTIRPKIVGQRVGQNTEKKSPTFGI